MKKISIPPLAILVAEDDRVNQLYIKTLLEKEGHSITLAGNGNEVYQLFLNEKFDVVLMDIQMPDVDGLEAVAHIRQFEKENALAPTPIFALSAYNDIEEDITGQNLQVDLILPKPLDSETIREALHRIFLHKTETRPSVDAEQEDFSHYEYQKKLLSEFADAEDTLISMLEMALNDIPVKMDTIEHTFLTGDTKSAAREAHSLANIVGVLYRPRERNTALTIEEKIEHGELSAARQCFSDYKEQINTLTHTFRAILFGSLSK